MDGTFRIKNRAGGLYIDTADQSVDKHSPLVQLPSGKSSTQKWELKRIYEISRFKSSNVMGTYIRHEGADNIIISSEFTSQPLEDSQWRTVPGLADSSCISLESVNKPGYYLRHKDGKLILSRNDESDIMKKDATWRISAGLSNASLTSLESYNLPGNYIRHKDGVMYISTISSDLDKADATFEQIKQ